MKNKKSYKNDNNFRSYIKNNDLLISKIYGFILKFKEIQLMRFIGKYTSIILILVFFLLIILILRKEFFGIIINIHKFIQIYYREIPSYILFTVALFNLLIAYSNFESIKKFNASLENEREKEKLNRMETYIEWLKGKQYYLNTFKTEHNNNFDFMPPVNLGLYIVEDMASENYVSSETIWGLKEMEIRINNKIDDFNKEDSNKLKIKTRNKIFKNIDTALKFIEIAINHFENEAD